jgi:hypothetical protein
MPGFKVHIPTPIVFDCPCPPGTGPASDTETARKHRYMLEVLAPLNFDSFLLFLLKCTRPGVEIDEIAIHNGQDEIFRPGKQHWKAVDFTFYEMLKDNGTGPAAQMDLIDRAAQLIYDWWSRLMINVGSSLHMPPENYLRDASLDMLDGNGSAVWSYALYDCWPSKISPCDLSYADTAIAEISVTLRYSKAREFKV